MKGFLLKGTFENPEPSTKRLLFFLSKVKEKSSTLYSVTIYTSRKIAVFTAKCPLNRRNTVTLNINIGKHSKTPRTGKQSYFLTGRTRVQGVRYKIAQSVDEAVFTRLDQTNLGAAFIGFDASDENGKNRGIGFHGNSTNTLEPTDGCIRMYNDDLLLLASLLNGEGIKVFIL